MNRLYVLSAGGPGRIRATVVKRLLATVLMPKHFQARYRRTCIATLSLKTVSTLL